MFSEGYVGVSVNPERRWEQHKTAQENTHLANAINKHGWENLVKSIILIADTDYCFDMEAKFRPKTHIGWNVIAGGGKGPANIGKDHPQYGKPKSEKTKEKISLANIGSNSGLFKGVIQATHRITGEIVNLIGASQMKQLGFNHSHVYQCILGKRKSHKGHTFKRIEETQ